MSMEKVIEEVKNVLYQEQTVSSAYLFGSIAKGRYRADSDLDIAVLFVPGLNKLKRFELRLELMGLLEEICQRRVDLIDLLEAPLFLQHQVRKYGKLIVEKDHAYRVRYEVQSRREYFDLQPVLERRQRALLKGFVKDSL
ncbi:nucleotidyltransferase domain-containing protein [Heliobacillus mobilis]|uniref:Nucleotidyltransferase domain-containing protein n=1 Tax=Heliobacterium mobile TaxID=28064 RepID=A0A6I3SP92_HELMO|nr:nucleotidyltransferase domain-containing protein [Heliobacterium mobile]MTV50536.1 nucleotidyltransferase domain-containing protein [Heliobacterium mobile]